VRRNVKARLAQKELRGLIPSNQDDIAAVHAAITRGYPAVKPIVYDLLKWVRVDSWPVAKPLLEFFAGVGPVLAPEIEVILNTRDNLWKSVVLRSIVVGWPADEIRRLAGPLFTIATDGQSWGADLLALRLLAVHAIGDPDWIAGWLEFKQEYEGRRLTEIHEISRILRSRETL
jgi:hypothetical protein